MNTLSVQPLDLGPKLQKVNFGSERFALEGYVNYTDVFVNTNSDKENTLSGRGTANSLKESSISSARFIYSLEYMGNEADSQHNLTAILTELYRVCCDGALIEVRCANSDCRDYDPFKQRDIGEKTWAFFDRQSRKLCKNAGSLLTWEQDERMVMALEALDRANINFKLLRSQINLDQLFLKKIQAGMYPTQQEFQEEIEANPCLITSYSFYLVCIKDENHTFALTDVNPYPSYVMRVYDKESDDIYVSHSIATQGNWEPNESFLILDTVSDVLKAARYEQGMRVANIGANMGWYTLLLANSFAQVKVDAFEPSPRTLEILQQNVQINALNDRVTVYPYALSQEAEECDLFLNEHNAGDNSLYIHSEVEFDRDRKVTIKTETMDRIYCGRPQSEWPDIIIIDTEGHEQMVWNGAKKMFAAGWRPVVFSEFAPWALKLRGECTYFIEWLEQYHYKAFNVYRRRPGLSPMSLDELKETYERLKDDKEYDYIDVLFVPEYMHLEGDKFVVD